MKIHILWHIPVMVVSIILGFSLAKVDLSLEYAHGMSQAGQTLSDLSRALEIEKNKEGHYPECIESISITSSSPEFSEKLISNVSYHRTDSGYVAFVGIPHLALISPGESPKFELNTEQGR